MMHICAERRVDMETREEKAFQILSRYFSTPRRLGFLLVTQAELICNERGRKSIHSAYVP
jgi:hypothetical protein